MSGALIELVIMMTWHVIECIILLCLAALCMHMCPHVVVIIALVHMYMACVFPEQYCTVYAHVVLITALVHMYMTCVFLEQYCTVCAHVSTYCSHYCTSPHVHGMCLPGTVLHCVCTCVHML